MRFRGGSDDRVEGVQGLLGDGSILPPEATAVRVSAQEQKGGAGDQRPESHFRIVWTMGDDIGMPREDGRHLCTSSRQQARQADKSEGMYVNDVVATR